uniref:Uncharacterized protein n=1 Tax=Anguilla anguilla TaxID=7936 RepID=A0A0E9W4Y7_ANGAN
MICKVLCKMQFITLYKSVQTYIQ